MRGRLISLTKLVDVLTFLAYGLLSITVNLVYIALIYGNDDAVWSEYSRWVGKRIKNPQTPVKVLHTRSHNYTSSPGQA